EKVADIRLATVLVVDDNIISREILGKKLEESGVKVFQAQNAQQALKILRAHVQNSSPIDLALIDTQILGINGVELVKAIRSQPQFTALNITLMTPYKWSEKGLKTALLGKVNYLKKPIKLNTLYASLSQAFVQYRESQNEMSDSKIDIRNEQTKSLHVLIAEDNVINQLVVVEMLKTLGYTMEIAENGQRAINLLQTTTVPFDVIMMDCQMPIMDGYETARAIRCSAHPNYPAEIPIIALTANAMKGDKENCLAAGMNSYLVKPIALKALSAELKRWISE
ncbi:MAG: two-component system sensor histidine kinase/response regulator, partial [Paraglaciecola sp.]